MRKVLLTGVTGDVGSKTLAVLEHAEIPLKVLCRRAQQASELERRGLEVVVADLNESIQDLSKHFNGCDSLFLCTAATLDQRRQCFSAIDAAVLAGVKWIVKISAADARSDSNVPWVKAHAAADRYLRDQAEQTGISWTILSASAFMQNILGEAPAIRNGFLPQACGSGKAGWVDTNDVAAVAAQVLMDGPHKHHAKNHIITGPQLISLPEVAAAMSRQVGHRVRYLDLPGPIFGLCLRLGGIDSWTANGLVAQFTEIVRPNKEGIEASDVVRCITGRPPKSFEQFAAEHKDYFVGTDIAPYLGAATGIALVCVCVLVLRKLA